MLTSLIYSVLGKNKSSEDRGFPGKVAVKDKGSTVTKPGCLAVALPPNQDGSSSKDTALDSKPKKGIIFEIHSEDGFHIRCESIEGE